MSLEFRQNEMSIPYYLLIIVSLLVAILIFWLATRSNGDTPPMPPVETETERDVLTPEIDSALGREASFVLAIEPGGKPILFERPETQDVVFPIPTKAILSQFIASFTSFEGSTCEYYTDSNGTQRKRCK